MNTLSEFGEVMTPATTHQDYESKGDSRRPQLLTSSRSLDLYFRKHLREENPKERISKCRMI